MAAALRRVIGIVVDGRWRRVLAVRGQRGRILVQPRIVERAVVDAALAEHAAVPLGLQSLAVQPLAAQKLFGALAQVAGTGAVVRREQGVR